MIKYPLNNKKFGRKIYMIYNKMSNKWDNIIIKNEIFIRKIWVMGNNLVDICKNIYNKW